MFQNNSFPERNTVYDFCFEKKASGSWIEWMDTIDKSSLVISPEAKVTSHSVLCYEARRKKWGAF